jgi:outer membrane protein assembly factor BamB
VWKAGDGSHSYCSMHRAVLAGMEQLVVATDVGLAAYNPANGHVLWQHKWPLQGGMARVIQPTILNDTDVLLGTGFGIGTRRVKVVRENDHIKPEAEIVWTTLAIKPYFNDMVTHKNHLYGFDGTFFTCVSLDDGKSKWKARGYGNGEVLLLPDQDMLLILSEKGEIALVEANPERHKEVAKFQALEGKTWNHPVIARGKLFLRNGEEMACYQLGEQSK